MKPRESNPLSSYAAPRFFLLFLAVAAATVLANGRVAKAGGGQSDDEAQIRQSLADWVKATNAGNRPLANTIWGKDLVGWYPGRPDDTYDREMQAGARPRTGKPTTTIAVTVNEVIVSGDLAVVRDTWTYTTPTPRPDLPKVIRSFEVWRKQSDGQWKIIRWISSPEPNEH